MVPASATECGPSQKAIAPASASRPISAISSPMSPLVRAAAGWMRTFASSRARRRMKSTTAGSSTGGLVSGRVTRHGDAPRGGGGAGAGDGLAMLGAWLADERAHVDEAGRNDVALAVDDPRLGRELVARDRGADAGDDAVDRDEPAARLGLPNWIDKARVDEGDRRR